MGPGKPQTFPNPWVGIFLGWKVRRPEPRLFQIAGQGHHGGQHRVFAHQIADLHIPFDEFGLGNAFANIRKLDDVLSPRSTLHHVD